MRKNPISIEKRNQLRVLLVGAGNRVEFGKLLLTAGAQMGKRVELFSIESSLRQPISSVASVISTELGFNSDGFVSLLREVAGDYGIDFVLPLMDSAIPAVLRSGVASPVNQSAIDVLDKLELKKSAIELGILVPNKVKYGRAHLRPRFGNGGRGVRIVEEVSELPKSDILTHLVEDVIEGEECSLDVYVFRNGDFTICARERLRIVGGEVQHTTTREATLDEKQIVDFLLGKYPLRGPINVQLKGSPQRLLEINPRFGGGSTASIRSGWNALEWVLKEYGCDDLIEGQSPKIRNLEVKRAWQDFYW